MNHMMGTGYLGETRMGPDGNLYQWVEGIDGLGNPIGFWSRLQRLRKKFKRFAQKALPVVQQVASQIPIPEAQEAAAKLTTAAQEAGVAGYGGLGALYEAPDGTLYQMQGLAEDEMTQVMGLGSYVGELRMGPDGNAYQWVQGVDGLGNPIGFWKRLKRKVKGFVKKAVPVVQQVASMVPLPQAQAVATGLKMATPFLRQAGVAGYEGLGVYQAPNGTLYQVQGLAEDEDLQGYGEDEALYGYGEDEELQGFADDEDLQGYGEEEELQGMEGYIRQNGMSGMEGYVREQRPMTPGFAPTQAWSPPW